MKVVNLSTQPSVISDILAELRNVNTQGNRRLFRQNIRRIGQCMAYELSKTLNYSPKEIQTPLASCQVSTCDDRLVIGTVMRAGLGLQEGFLDAFPGAESAFVAAYREEGSPQDIKIHLDYVASPQLDDCTFLLVDPMLATGGSLVRAWEAYRRNGSPKHLHICCVVAAEQGVKHLQEVFPSDDVTLWAAAIDPILNQHAYIVPGLGDCGDLCYGEKL